MIENDNEIRKYHHSLLQSIYLASSCIRIIRVRHQRISDTTDVYKNTEEEAK